MSEEVTATASVMLLPPPRMRHDSQLWSERTDFSGPGIRDSENVFPLSLEEEDITRFAHSSNKNHGNWLKTELRSKKIFFSNPFSFVYNLLFAWPILMNLVPKYKRRKYMSVYSIVYNQFFLNKWTVEYLTFDSAYTGLLKPLLSCRSN